MPAILWDSKKTTKNMITDFLSPKFHLFQNYWTKLD